jgi:hypothetical protein
MCIIRLGGEEADFLVLTVHGRAFPASTDYWDGNWLRCTAEVVAGAFRGRMDRTLRNEELARFLLRLEGLYERLSGEALFDTLEHWLDLRIIGDGRGHMKARGQLRDDPVCGNVLEFRLYFDQTSLPSLMRQVRAVLAAFPVVGQVSG